MLYTDNHSDINLNAIFLGMAKSNPTNAHPLTTIPTHVVDAMFYTRYKYERLPRHGKTNLQYFGVNSKRAFQLGTFHALK